MAKKKANCPKWYEKFNDPAFTRYFESGEAAIVHIVRDLAENINTNGKWIDVFEDLDWIETLGNSETSDTKYHLALVELFPILTKPQYTDDEDENRYLTWHAAHDDIKKHRSLGTAAALNGRTEIILYQSGCISVYTIKSFRMCNASTIRKTFLLLRLSEMHKSQPKLLFFDVQCDKIALTRKIFRKSLRVFCLISV